MAYNDEASLVIHFDCRQVPRESSRRMWLGTRNDKKVTNRDHTNGETIETDATWHQISQQRGKMSQCSHLQ